MPWRPGRWTLIIGRKTGRVYGQKWIGPWTKRLDDLGSTVKYLKLNRAKQLAFSLEAAKTLLFFTPWKPRRRKQSFGSWARSLGSQGQVSRLNLASWPLTRHTSAVKHCRGLPDLWGESEAIGDRCCNGTCPTGVPKWS